MASHSAKHLPQAFLPHRKATPMSEQQIATVEARLPSQLLTEANVLVQKGWFGSVDEVIADALRRFLESHRDEVMAQFVKEDVEWGLRGET